MIKKVTIGEFGKTNLQVSANSQDAQDDTWGLFVGAVSQDKLDAAGLQHGVLVKGVTENSAASKAGIQVADIIVSINGVAMMGSADIAKISAQTGSKPMPVLLQRGDRSLYVALETESLHQ